MMIRNGDGRKLLKWLVLSILIVTLWTGFCIGSGTDVDVSIDVIGSGTTVPAEGVHWHFQGDTINFTATPADGWYFNRWINGNGDDLDDPNSANTFLFIESLMNITITAVFTSNVDSSPIPEIVIPVGDTTIVPGESINFHGSAADGNPPYTFQWDFDGGIANANEEDPGRQIFNTPGVYQVTLTVFDDDDDSGTTSITITVTGGDDDGDGGGGGGGCFMNTLRSN
jgi:PKD domain/Divergent InlB B-repeat domain